MARRSIKLRKDSPLYSRAAKSRKAGTATPGAPGIDIADPVKPGVTMTPLKSTQSSGFDKRAKDAQGLNFEERKVLRGRGLKQGTDAWNKAAQKFSKLTLSEEAKLAREQSGMQPDPTAIKTGRASSSGAGKGRTGTDVKGTTGPRGGTDVRVVSPGDEMPDLGSPEDIARPGVGAFEGADLPSYAEIGEANIQSEFDANIASELEFLDDAKGFTSLDEYFKAQFDALQGDTAAQQEALDLQKQQIGEETSDIRNQMQSQAEAFSGLLSGAEGAVSFSNISAYDRAKEAASVQISRLQRDQQAAFTQIEQTRKQLELAEREGNTQLASQYRQQLIAAESQAMATETAYVNALMNASQEERMQQAQNIANLQAFTNMVDTGAEMSVDGIMSFADQLGVDFESAYNYYAGAQAIRDDKSLDLEAKNIALEQLKNEFNDELAGLASEEAQAVRDFELLVKSGDWTEEQLQSFAISMGIPDSRNPVFQAELALEEAELSIKQKEADGIPVTQSDWAKYYDNIEKVNEIYGTGGEAYLPNNSLEGITSEYSGGRLSIATNTPYQCGEFVNRFWGLASGASGGFGSTYADKTGVVDARGILAENVNINNYTQVLKPGMAFVSQAGDTGHVGIITQILPDGRFQTMEANIGDDNPNTDDVPIPHTRSIKDLDIYGYAPPPGDFSMIGGDGTQAGFSDLDTGFKIMQSQLSEKKAEQVQKVYEDYVSSGNYEGAKEFLQTTALNSLNAADQTRAMGQFKTVTALEDIQNSLAELEAEGIDTGIFKGTHEKVMNKIGKTLDGDLAETATKIQLAIQSYRQSISGAAFSEMESLEYSKVFPSIEKTGELNAANIAALNDYLNGQLKSTVEFQLGGSVYDSIFNEPEATEEVVEVQTSQPGWRDEADTTQMGQVDDII